MITKLSLHGDEALEVYESWLAIHFLLVVYMPITLSDPKRPFGNGAIFDD